MDFEFDEDQVAFGAAVRRFLDAKLPPSRLRTIWDEGQGYRHEVWRELAGLGVAGSLVDEAHGGSGGRLTDLVLVLGELGTHAVPEPAVETAVVAPLVLSGFGAPALQQEWLPQIAAGDTIVAVAARPEGARVPDGATADVTLVRSGHEVHLVRPQRVTARPLAGADPSRRLAECDYRLDDSTLVTVDPAASLLIDTAGAAGTAALLVGLCDRLVDLTREHLLTRQQFGRPLAEFQVLKHRLVDVAVAVEAARSLTWNAGYRVGVGDPGAAMAARAAKAAASEAASRAGAAALQLHGGIGFTWEHDLHLWLQRAMSWERSFGIARELRAQMGAELLEAK
ncbi:acyl-CoA dehydrogenase family protein [Aeromicrobium endophyticum]|uniref:acyl-CoA dehydrogenase family protein n=1 Tax=Aeromicrobium endophyticum TaxID=2292704 RepID=UPI0013147407|nr:acyl-CoA dehydrogenase family protein [Aeromicrobium endophyticum]